MLMDSQFLDYVFGPKSVGTTAPERARTSKFVFVRSQDHLALDKPTASGRKITALEALEAYGLETIREVIDRGSAILPASNGEPAATLKNRRLALGLSVEDISRITGLPLGDIEDAENSETRSPIRNLERIAAALGLDERKVSVEAGAGGDDGLAARLKTLGGGPHRLSPSAVVVISEAAWVIRTHDRLLKQLSIDRRLPSEFEPSDNYGESGYPAWQHGYYLADKARQILGIRSDEPIRSLRNVCQKLQIPLLQGTLPEHLAGVTVVSMGQRGIVANTRGYNSNVWVRRATIAHELGHLFWDPDKRLNRVTVDGYEVVDALDRDRSDHVEARANAFAIAFLAPLGAVEREFQNQSNHSAALRTIMEKFGISYTAAKYHAWNATDRKLDRDRLTVKDIEPTDEWRGTEAYTDDYFPLKNTSQLRRGDFAGLVVASERRKQISLDTACLYLQTQPKEYAQGAETIEELFPITEL
jgi:transcriptional regulator with XRE-family HTH domain